MPLLKRRGNKFGGLVGESDNESAQLHSSDRDRKLQFSRCEDRALKVLPRTKLLFFTLLVQGKYRWNGTLLWETENKGCWSTESPSWMVKERLWKNSLTHRSVCVRARREKKKRSPSPKEKEITVATTNPFLSSCDKVSLKRTFQA